MCLPLYMSVNQWLQSNGEKKKTFIFHKTFLLFSTISFVNALNSMMYINHIHWILYSENFQSNLAKNSMSDYLFVCVLYEVLKNVFTNPSAQAGGDTRSIFK